MIDYTNISKCRVCGSTELREVYKIDDLYVNDFPATPEGHRGKAPMTLLECQGCTLVQLRETVSQDIYRDYWYQSKLNRKIVDNLADIANNAMDFVNGKVDANPIALDIGANDGTLLLNYPGEFVTVGVDPAVNIHADLTDIADFAINDFFTAAAYNKKLDGQKADIITAVAMFYDLDDPHAFLSDIKSIMSPNGVFIAQFMGLPHMVNINDVGNLCHEHLPYYTWKSLEVLFSAHDLTIVDLKHNDINGGSWQIWVQHKREGQAVVDYHGDIVSIDDFAKGLYDIKEDLQHFLEMCKAEEKKVYIYGASTKGNTIEGGTSEIQLNIISKRILGLGQKV